MQEFILVLMISTLWHGLGVTVGYHRLLAHRSFQCSKALEYFLILGGYLAFQGSPIWWASVHRTHHRHADTDSDIHSPKDGKLHAYAGWMSDDIELPVETISSDVCNDPMYRFLDRIDEHWKVPLAIALRLPLLALFGWKFALASLLSGVYALQIPLLLNLACHLPRLGYKNFESNDNAVNVWWMGYLAFGEGWHNNHHVYPGSPRMGLAPWEFDLSWCSIWTLHKLGLITRLNQQPAFAGYVESPPAVPEANSDSRLTSERVLTEPEDGVATSSGLQPPKGAYDAPLRDVREFTQVATGSATNKH